MGLFDKVKSLVQEMASDGASKMQICMLGARGVGKTSVLTSMFNDLNSTSSNTNLMLVASTMDNGWTSNTIIEKKEQLKRTFVDSSKSKFLVDSGIEGDLEVHTYKFQFGLKSDRTRIDLDIRDYPGEYVITEPDTVKSYIDDSNAIIVAIDTPHLIEDNGRYNESKNRTKDITEFFKAAFSNLDEDKLVLLVPLKCEKYKEENRLEDVKSAVQNTYSDLIDFFKNCEARKHIVCAITPIFTMGEIVFDSFETNDDGSLLLNKVYNLNNFVCGELPVAKYKFTKVGAKYTPKYCEQPLCYLLSFVTKLYYRTKDSNQAGLLKKIINVFKLFPDNPALLMEASKLGAKIIKEKDGYSIVTGKSKL